MEDEQQHGSHYEKWLSDLERAVRLPKGLCLDLGGNNGRLRDAFERRGYRYVNMDIRRFKNGEPSLIGDAHRLPIKDATVDLIVSKDTLEHFLEPWTVIKEVHRVLRPKGQFAISVPFMHPFHGDDVYRFTPLGLKHLFRDFDFVLFDTSAWVFTVIGLAMTEALSRIGLGFTRPALMRFCHLLDRVFIRRQKRPAAFAATYRLVVSKREG